MFYITCWKCGICHATLCHNVALCDPCGYNVYYIKYDPPATPSNLMAHSPCSVTGNLLLDLHHARFSQDLLMGHGPLSGQKPSEKVPGLCEVSIRSICEVCHLHPLSTFKDACPWLSIGHKLLDLQHARFSQDFPIGHDPLQQTVYTRMHKCCAIVFTHTYVLQCSTGPHPKYMAIGIC